MENESQVMAKVRRLYHQKYRDDWERFPPFADWLCRGSDGYTAHCKICDATVLARLASIKQHHSTAKHQKALGEQKCVSFGQQKLQPKQKTNQEPCASKPVAASKSKQKEKRIKMEKTYSPESVEEETCSNDSILEDLLGNDDIEHKYFQEISEPELESEVKSEHFQEYKVDDVQDEIINDDNIISEFDLFGKSVSLQLNHMELEDALLCQERLQVVLTEFRLKILKRKGKRN